jgi:hypothetical protein
MTLFGEVPRMAVVPVCVVGVYYVYCADSELQPSSVMKWVDGP